MGFPGGSHGKESACDAGDLDSIPGSGRSPGGGTDIHSVLKRPTQMGHVMCVSILTVSLIVLP